MKICVAQARSIPGDIQQNIVNHQKLIDLAVSHRADIIIFPELSITGYEPTLAKELATDKDDSRFLIFQEISDTHQVTIGIGVPIKHDPKPRIGMVIFQPGKERQLYTKKYLHVDEIPFFTPGENLAGLKICDTNITLAICYELSVPEHSENAYKSGASVYLTSVAKTPGGVENAYLTLYEIASNYSMTVLMANCVGECEGQTAGGKTAIWNNKGMLTGALSATEEGILIVDTTTEEVIKQMI